MTAANMCVNCFRSLEGASFCTACGWPAHPPPGSPLHLPPRMLLKETYVLGRVLGHGGFGITYAAYDPALDRRLAIKEYLPNGEATRGTGEARIHPLSGSSEEAFRWGLEKFLEEARVLVRFQDHPGIVKVITFFSENGTAYLVMEHLEGQNLEARLQQIGGKISFASALQVMMPVIDALREVHKTGILHRDISPDNVFLCDNRQIKLIDFGAARYAMGEKSKSLSILIKDGYAPEEQYRTKGKQGPWTDVYAAAATIYRAVTGSLPPTSLDRLHEDDLQDPRHLGAEISEAGWHVLHKGLAVRAADRYESMEEFQAALLGTDEGHTLAQAGLRPAPSPQPPLPTPQPAPKPLPPPNPIVIPTPVPHPWWKRYQAALGATAVALLAGIFIIQRSCGEPAAAAINKFAANPAKLQASGQATLEWKVSGATEVEIEPGIGKRKAEGSLSISPLASTTYVLTAKNEAGKEVRQEFRVEVEPAPTPAPTPEPTPTPQPEPQPDTTPQPKPAPFPTPQPKPPYTPQPTPQPFPQPTPQPPPQVTPTPQPQPTPPQPFPPTESNRTRNPLAAQPGSFLVHHDHQGLVGGILGSNRVNQIWQHCTGRLYVANGRLNFQSAQAGHSFSIPMKQIKEIKSNRMALAGRKAFHVDVQGGEKYNFVPEEAVKDVVDALSASLK